MNQISVYLTLMALPHETDTITLHSEPIVPCSKNLLCQYISAHMWPTNSSMYLCHNCHGLTSIYTSQQSQIWCSFVQHSPTEEKSICQSPNGSLLISCGLFRVYPHPEVFLDIIKPWLAIYFFLYHVALNVLITNPDMQWVNMNFIWVVQH